MIWWWNNGEWKEWKPCWSVAIIGWRLTNWSVDWGFVIEWWFDWSVTARWPMVILISCQSQPDYNRTARLSLFSLSIIPSPNHQTLFDHQNSKSTTLGNTPSSQSSKRWIPKQPPSRASRTSKAFPPSKTVYVLLFSSIRLGDWLDRWCDPWRIWLWVGWLNNGEWKGVKKSESLAVLL